MAGKIARPVRRSRRHSGAVGDTFVAVGPNGAMDPEDLVEDVVLGSDWHLHLIPEVGVQSRVRSHNGGLERQPRDGARQAEAMPQLHKVDEVTVMVVPGQVADKSRMKAADLIVMGGHARMRERLLGGVRPCRSRIAAKSVMPV
jgi:nucleotide-binding universal stress UspA family protein